MTPHFSANHRLWDAARLGDAGALKQALADGADPQAFAPCGRLPLSLAAYLGWRLCVERLLDAGADLNAACLPDRFTALMSACEQSNLRCVEALLLAGADLGALSAKGDQALSIAAGSSGCVRALLAAGADATAIGARGEGALFKAVRAGSEGSVAALIHAGADPARKNDDGVCCWDLAASKQLTRSAMERALAQKEASELRGSLVDRSPLSKASSGPRI